MNTIERRITTARRKYAAAKVLLNNAQALKAKGMSNVAIAQKLGIAESSLRYLMRER